MIAETRHRYPLASIDSARDSIRRFAVERASDDELLAMVAEHDTEYTLLRGDLVARDYSVFSEAVLREGIAFHQNELTEITRQIDRRLRVRRVTRSTGGDTQADYQARFDAMRRVDLIEALQTLGLQLQKRGREWWALCPFHEERTPSFAANQEKGVWHCHGCLRGGDLITFVTLQHGLNRVEALNFLEAVGIGVMAA